MIYENFILKIPPTPLFPFHSFGPNRVVLRGSSILIPHGAWSAIRGPRGRTWVGCVQCKCATRCSSYSVWKPSVLQKVRVTYYSPECCLKWSIVFIFCFTFGLHRQCSWITPGSLNQSCQESNWGQRHARCCFTWCPLSGLKEYVHCLEIKAVEYLRNVY